MSRRAALLPVLALLLAGCGGPTRLQPAPDTVPAGFERVTCPVRSDHGEVTLALALPRGYTAYDGADRPQGAACAWRRTATVRPDSPDPSDRPYAVDLVVTVRYSGEPLSEVRDAEERYAAEGDEPAGDDSVLHLRLREDVATYGATRGDRLSWRCTCDGQELLERRAQADGVRLSWSSVVALGRGTDAQLERVLASLGTSGLAR